VKWRSSSQLASILGQPGLTKGFRLACHAPRESHWLQAESTQVWSGIGVPSLANPIVEDVESLSYVVMGLQGPVP